MFYLEIRSISEISVKKLFRVNCYIVPYYLVHLKLQRYEKFPYTLI